MTSSTNIMPGSDKVEGGEWGAGKEPNTGCKREGRQTKTIKLADSSIAGRRATAEYVKNPMVSDSENEKRI